MIAFWLTVGDMLGSVLIALPYLNSFSYIPSTLFTGTETSLITALFSPIVLAWMPWRGWKKSLQILSWGLVLASVLNSFIAIYQYFGFPDRFLIAPLAVGDAGGNVRQTNLLATLLVVSLLCLYWLYRTDALPFRKLSLKRSFALAVGALLLIALAATASRTGMCEILVAVLVVIGYRWRTQREAKGPAHQGAPLLRGPILLGVLALVFYTLFVFVLPALLTHSQGLSGRNLIQRWETAETSCNSRLILYSNVLHLIGLRPWTGWGWSNLAWANFSTLFDQKRLCNPWLDNAHNLPLHLAVTLGIPAALLICGGVLYLILRARPWRAVAPERQLAWSILLMMGLHSMVEYPLWYGPFQVITLLCLLLLATTREGNSPGGAIVSSLQSPRRPVWGSLLAGVVLAFSIYAVWDYWRISQLFIPVAMRAPQWREDPITPASKSWLFADYVRLAVVVGTPVTRDNAGRILPLAILALRLGPSPNAIGKIVESAAMLGRKDLAQAYMERFFQADHKHYHEWAVQHTDLVNELLPQSLLEVGQPSAVMRQP